METPHVFGQHDHLFGIHTDAALCGNQEDCFENSDIAVIMLTAGMLSHVGPSRLHVSLAESLSLHGISSFRFDLSGIGESLPIGGQGASLARATSEVQQAMDYLQEKYSYSRFMLFGLCSGADDAIAAALEDDRIVAISSLDGCGYPTKKHFVQSSIRKYLPKVLSATKWMELTGNWLREESSKGASMPFGSDIREFPEREQAEQDLLSLVERGVHLQFIYTGGSIDYYSYKRQFYDMFPLLVGRCEITVQYHPRWDHVAMLEEDRIELVAALQGWFVETIAEIHAEHIGI